MVRSVRCYHIGMSQDEHMRVGLRVKLAHVLASGHRAAELHKYRDKTSHVFWNAYIPPLTPKPLAQDTAA